MKIFFSMGLFANISINVLIQMVERLGFVHAHFLRYKKKHNFPHLHHLQPIRFFRAESFYQP